MSKSFGNYTDPNELMDLYGADALRFLLLQSPLLNGEDFSLQDKDVQDVQRKLAMAWNMFDFFTLYAEVDGWEWDGSIDDPSHDLTNPLDQWIVSRVHQLTKHVDEHMQGYDIPNALTEVLPFLDDASNWYVRRNRRRFWKAGDDADKNDAYRTLQYVLVQFAITVAPFTPFLAEELFQKLTGDQVSESVHLLDWPDVGHINELVLEDMAELRELINQGLSVRAAEGLKVRQPLASAELLPKREFQANYRSAFAEIAQEELNVKQVSLGKSHDTSEVKKRIKLDTTISPSLRREGLVREVIRNVQNARKQAGLQVDDRIELYLESTDQEINKAIAEYTALIETETLTTRMASGKVVDGYESVTNIEKQPLVVSLKAIL